MGIEGAVAQHYWKHFAKVIPEEEYECEERTGSYHTRPPGAGEQVNCMLNMGITFSKPSVCVSSTV